jgi:SAM-dependent methyltransferase
VVGGFYESHPYPPPADDIAAYRRSWNDERRRADSFLFWPDEPYRDDRSILVAGCGTLQAAHYALRWPNARVVGIDVGAPSIEFERRLKAAHGLRNLELRVLPIERVAELGESFDSVVCTGVLHHLADPDAGLRALHGVLAPAGAMHVMVYAPYGRAGVYAIQEYCRSLGLGWSDRDVDDLAATLRALPPDHPLVPLLRASPDFASKDGLADALLHPRDRPYVVSEFLEFLRRAGLRFGRWIRQAPYLPSCGAIASTPHAERIAALAAERQYAALELFRGTMVRHAAVAYRADAAPARRVDFGGEEWPDYVPVRAAGTVVVRERLPAGAAAVLVNRNHTYTDLYLPIDAEQERMLAAIDGRRTIAELAGGRRADGARDFFERLWRWDQVVFDISRSGRATAS